MQMITFSILIDFFKIVINSMHATSIIIFHALFQNIWQEINGLIDPGNKIFWAILLIGSFTVLVQFAKVRKLDFIRSILGF